MAVTGIKLKSKPLDQVREDVPVHKVGNDEMVRLNMLIGRAERTQWKRAALDLGTDMSTLVREAVRKYLHEQGKL